MRGRAAGQGMVFWPPCPKLGIQFDLPLPYTGSEPVLNRVWYYEPRDLNPECEQGLMVFTSWYVHHTMRYSDGWMSLHSRKQLIYALNPH